MRYGGDELITAIINKLEVENTISYSGLDIPVYSEVPNDATFPLISVTPYAIVETDDNKTRENHQITVQIDVKTKYKTGAGGYGASQNIAAQITDILRVKGSTLSLSNNFSCYSQTLSTIQPLRESYKDGTVFRMIMLFDFKISDDE